MILKTNTEGEVICVPRENKATATVKEDTGVPFVYPKANRATGFSRRLIYDHDLKPINPVQCGRQKCPPSYAFKPLVRDFWLLHFVISGKGVLTNARGTHTVKKNEMFVMRPQEKATYRADAEDPWEYVWIGFYTTHPMPHLLETHDVISVPYLKPLFESAHSAEGFENGNTFGAYEHYLCGIIWQILGALMNRSPKDNNVMDTYIRPAINMMQHNYWYRITVSDIAAQLHISKGYFSEIFKKETGVSPKKYLNDLRMKQAAKYLTEGEHNVTTVAASVGFPDVFVFSRAFKQHYHCSPSEYAKRESVQSGTAPLKK